MRCYGATMRQPDDYCQGDENIWRRTNLINESKEDFSKLYLCNFEPNEKDIELDKMLLQYYNDTEFCDNKQAREKWREFKRWAIGYSSKEINAAKCRVGHLAP